MAGFSAQEFPLGGGYVEIAAWDGATPPEDADYVDLGSINKATLSIKTEVAQKKTNYTGPLLLTAQDVIESGETIKMTLDQVNQDTLAMFFLGTKVGATTVWHLTEPLAEYAVRIRPRYIRGTNYNHQFWKGTFKPSGDWEVFTQKDYGMISFEFEVLADIENHASNPYGLSTSETL